MCKIYCCISGVLKFHYEPVNENTYCMYYLINVIFICKCFETQMKFCFYEICCIKKWFHSCGNLSIMMRIKNLKLIILLCLKFSIYMFKIMSLSVPSVSLYEDRFNNTNYYTPANQVAGVYSDPYVRPSVRLSVRSFVCPFVPPNL